MNVKIILTMFTTYGVSLITTVSCRFIISMVNMVNSLPCHVVPSIYRTVRSTLGHERSTNIFSGAGTECIFSLGHESQLVIFCGAGNECI